MSAPASGLGLDMGMVARRPVRVVRQAEAAECGLACLAMIANAWGSNLDLGSLRRRFGLTSRGVSLRTLMQTADAMGFTSRPLKTGVGGLASVQLPAGEDQYLYSGDME